MTCPHALAMASLARRTCPFARRFTGAAIPASSSYVAARAAACPAVRALGGPDHVLAQLRAVATGATTASATALPPPPAPMPSARRAPAATTTPMTTTTTAGDAISKARGFGYDAFLEQELGALRRDGLYRVFHHMRREIDALPLTTHADDGSVVASWCTNDYLGMTRNDTVLAAMQDALVRYGSGSGGTRNISGSSFLHRELESEVALLHGVGRGLVFQSCYVANTTTLETLGRALPGAIFFSDEGNHASLIHGMRYSRAEKHIVPHNDVPALRAALAAAPEGAPKIVVFQSVYSMTGTVAPIAEILDACDEFGALSFIDEVHAVGLYGRDGAGIMERDGLAGRADLISGTFGKAYGVGGGYVAGRPALIDLVRSKAPGFIFTTSLSPVVAAGAAASVRFLRGDDGRRLRGAFHDNVQRLKHALASAGLPVLPTMSHIVPIAVGDEAACKAMSDGLLRQHGIYIQPINFPTVPRGEAILRITISPLHTPEMIAALTTALVEQFDAAGLIGGARAAAA